MARYIDATLTISGALPTWPGDPPILLEQAASMERGDPCNVSRLEAGVHMGTHIDAPLHFLPGGTTVDQLSLDVLIGPCQVVELSGQGLISAAELAEAGVAEGVRRLLLKTSNSAFWSEPQQVFHTDYRALDVDAAEWLLARGIALIGIDYLSIEAYDALEGNPVHCALLERNVVIVEGLNLGQASPGRYQLICLPLKLGGADGAPARVVLEPL